jgi:hypothetical protein
VKIKSRQLTLMFGMVDTSHNPRKRPKPILSNPATKELNRCQDSQPLSVRWKTSALGTIYRHLPL